MMEAASTSETSVNFYQTTRRNNPEDTNFRKGLNIYMIEDIFGQSVIKIALSGGEHV
jgi:hypothetical protein